MQSNETQRRERAARIWLEYFNRLLREKQVISETDFFSIASLIRSKYPGKTSQP